MLVKEKFCRLNLLKEKYFFIKIFLCFLFPTSIAYSDLKQDLINKLIITETLTFNFKQKIAEKEEVGICFIKYPLLNMMVIEFNKIVIINLMFILNLVSP